MKMMIWSSLTNNPEWLYIPVMEVAKSETAMVKLAKDFFDRNLDRIYYAFVWGDSKADEGTKLK